VFATVAEARSFTAAAELHCMTPSAVSKAIRRLEHALGVRLVARTTRALHLTDEGIRFHELSARALGLLVDAYEDAAATTNDARGVVRIGMPPLFGTYLMPTVLAGLRAKHPNLRVEIVSTMHASELVERALDLVIAVGPIVDSSFVAQPLGVGQFVTVAAPGYLSRAGTPATPAEVARHACLVYTASDGRPVPWAFAFEDEVRSVAVDAAVRSDEMHHLAALAAAGLGIAQLPLMAIADDVAAGRLMRLLTAYEPPPKPASLVYLSGRSLPHRVRAVLDHLAAQAAIPGTTRHRDRPRKAATGT
jgi:DNA-binding transcriptional LysR family regulator